MAKLTRVSAKVFAASAAADEIGQFGSAVAGAKLETADVATIQGLSAWLSGWSEALVSGNRYPSLQEMNGLLKVLSYQGAYALQEGIAEYDSATTYYIGSIVKKTGTFELYGSLTDDNVGNALTVDTEWQFLVDLASVGNVISYLPYSVNSGLTSINRVSDTEVSFTGAPTVTFPNGNVYKSLTLNNVTGISSNDTYVFIIEEDDISSGAVTPKAVSYSKVNEITSYASGGSDGDYSLAIHVTPLYPEKKISGTWTATQFLKLGEATKTSGTLGTPITYALNGYYYSDSVTPVFNSYQSFSHNIGTNKIETSIKLKCVTADLSYVAGDLTENVTLDLGNYVSNPLKPYILRKNTLGLNPGAYGCGFLFQYGGGYNTGGTLSRWRYVIEARRNF